MEPTCILTDALAELVLSAEGVTRARPLSISAQGFLVVDPLADLEPGLTPYRYAYNDPINYIDPDGLFETKAEAKEHRRNTEGMGWLRGDRVREQSDGTYAIENDKTHATTSRLTDNDGNDLGVHTGAMVSAGDVMSSESGMMEQSFGSRFFNGDQILTTNIHRDGSTSTEQRDFGVQGTAPDVGPGKVLKGYSYIRTIGKKYDVFQKTVASKKLGGQARAVYTKIRNQDGNTVRVFKDAFKRDGRHYERANKLPTEGRSRPLD